MCGRYAITLPPEAIRALFGYVEQPNFPPRYNIAPTQPIPIVRLERDGADRTARHFWLVRWGFVPGFVKDFGSFRPIVNARSEGLDEKPSFRAAFRRRRCLVVADGFYEWRQDGTTKQPFLIRRRDGRPMGLAGIWEHWLGSDGSELETACIITAEATGALASVHQRAPVVIEPAAFDLWLDLDEGGMRDAAALLRSPPSEAFTLTPVGPGVNKVSNDADWIQAPIAETSDGKAAPRRETTALPAEGPVQGTLF